MWMPVADVFEVMYNYLTGERTIAPHKKKRKISELIASVQAKDKSLKNFLCSPEEFIFFCFVFKFFMLFIFSGLGAIYGYLTS